MTDSTQGVTQGKQLSLPQLGVYNARQEQPVVKTTAFFFKFLLDRFYERQFFNLDNQSTESTGGSVFSECSVMRAICNLNKQCRS